MLPNLQKLTLHHNQFLGQVPQSICNLRESTLHSLWVDCSPLPDVPKVSCPISNCCTICFEGYDSDGGPSTGGTSPSSVSAETPHEVQNDKASALKDTLKAASADKGKALMNISSPQFHAYLWLVEDSTTKEGIAAERLLQRYALATLYIATDGPHWIQNRNWITAEHECDWFGIVGCVDTDEANAEGAIDAIYLKENGLRGRIPPELFEFFPEITALNLATNELVGPIPREIGMLTKVGILELAENQLTSIPAELGNLLSVSHVFLQANNFGGQHMPKEVCALRSRPGLLTLLWSDCRGGQASSVQCDKSCCTTCFSGKASSDVFDSGTGGKSNGAVMHADSNGSFLATLKKVAPGALKFSSDLLDSHII